MQTKLKQKLTAVTIAFTMILTTIFQLSVPLTAHAEETRTININSSIIIPKWTEERSYTLSCEHSINGIGYFVKRSYIYKEREKQGDNYYNIGGFILSNKPFTYSFISVDNGTSYSFDNQQSDEYNGIYYCGIASLSCGNIDGVYEVTNLGTLIECNQNIFTQLKEDIDKGLIDVSKDDYVEKTFDEVATYDENIPTPKFKVEKNSRFEFLNNESDYYYEVKGRWYTTDDFYLHLGGFMNAIWLYDYETIYKNELTDWITYKDKRNTAITGYLKDIGEKSFNDLITKYPVGTRQITGEKNKDGSYKAGFDHASSNLVMWLKDATSIYNGIEVYIRYYKVDENGNYTYGKWAHYYNSLAKQSGAEVNDNVLNDVEHNYSDKGLTTEELKDLENSGQSKGDTDIITDYGDNGGGILSDIDKLDEADFSKVVKVILSLFEQTKVIFNMFTTVISFMPNWVIDLIGVSVAIICLIGIWKALR